MKNYLTPILDDYFKEITKLEGLLFLIEISLNILRGILKQNLIEALQNYLLPTGI